MNKDILMTIKDKTTYLTFRDEWRETYKKLSQTIRTEKHAFKKAQRNNDYLAGEKCRRNLRAFKDDARGMLAMRLDSKVIAGKQHDKNKSIIQSEKINITTPSIA